MAERGEQLRGVGGEVGGGEPQRGGDADVLGGEQREPLALVGEPVGEEARPRAGSSTSRAAATRSASGRPAAQLGCAAGRLGLGGGAVLAEEAVSRATLSSVARTSRARTRAASEATRPVRRARLVTTVTRPGPVGSSGRTWAEVRALSRTTSRRSSAVSERNRTPAASADSGIRQGGTSRATRNSRSSSAGSGSEVSLNPRRSA